MVKGLEARAYARILRKTLLGSTPPHGSQNTGLPVLTARTRVGDVAALVRARNKTAAGRAPPAPVLLQRAQHLRNRPRFFGRASARRLSLWVE
jgi:hypothetical protein